MSLEQEVQTLTQAVNQQTSVAQGLAQEVAGKMAALDQKANTSIAKVESSYSQKAAGLTIIATDGYKKAIEDASGGKNTVVYDADGNPNVMYVLQRFNYEDLPLSTLDLGTGIPTAFQTNGVPRSEILIPRYLASTMGAGTACIGGKQPRTSVNFDTAKALCERKGAGWHLMSAHEWAAIALIAMANNTVPRGNTNYGRSHEKYWETARRADNGMPGDTSGTARTDAGKGPAAWNHDHSDFGIADLVGNVWEWIDQFKLQDGRIITTLDNDPSIAEANWTKMAAYLDGSTAIGGAPVLNSKIVNRFGDLGDDQNAGNSASAAFQAVTKDPSYTANQLLRRLLVESAVTTGNATGSLYMRNFGERLPFRGGYWNSGAGAGLGALGLGNSRLNASSGFGFRPALFV